jgi:hypothetical protein
MEFLGESYWEPPFPRLYAPVMTLATVPTITWVLALVGVLAAGAVLVGELRERRPMGDRSRVALLLAGAVAISYAPWSSSSTPIFGGTKHWIQAYPFVAIFAGWGFERVRSELAQLGLLASSGPRGRVAASVAAAALVLVAPAVETLRAHPFGLSYYVPLVGGPRGGATLGLHRGFWGYTTGSLVGWLDREVPPNGRLYLHDTALEAWRMLVEDGRVRGDIEPVGAIHDADVALYHHEMHMQGEEYQAWVAYETRRPAIVAGLDGVPVIWVYRRAPAIHTRPAASTSAPGGAGAHR